MIVAALYIDPRGPYPKLPGVDCWDESRDARKYDGPHPVVAHPPCGPWGSLKGHCTKQDKTLAPIAIEQVRKWGGVLEHPANSGLWKYSAGFTYQMLPLPGRLPDVYGGYTVELRQCDWGHVAEKRTWLYCVGVPSSALEWPDRREPTHWVSGVKSRKKPGGGVLPAHMKFCSNTQRRRSPIAFAEYLVRLARAAGAARRVA